MFYNKLNKEESKDWGGGGQMRYLDPTQQYQEEEEEASACLPGHTRSKKKVYHTHNNKGEERGRRRLNYRELVYCTWFECRPKTRPNVSGRLLLLLFHINCWSMSARWPISVVCTAPWPIFESLCVLLNMWRGWRARGGGEAVSYVQLFEWYHSFDRPHYISFCPLHSIPDEMRSMNQTTIATQLCPPTHFDPVCTNRALSVVSVCLFAVLWQQQKPVSSTADQYGTGRNQLVIVCSINTRRDKTRQEMETGNEEETQ